MYYQFNSDMFPHISHMGLSSSTVPYLHPHRVPDEYILFIVKSGTFYISENDHDYTLKAGDMLILDPEAAHFGKYPSVDDRYYIHLASTVFSPFYPASPGALTDLLKANRQLNYTASPGSQDRYAHGSLILPKHMTIEDSALLHKIDLSMEQAIFASEHRHEHYKLTCSACFLQIMIAMAQYFSAKTLAITNENFSRSQQLLLDSLMQYLHENYMKKLTSADLEKHFQMNYDYLNRLFKKKNGAPIFNYLNTIRIDKAVDMLICSDTKACEIAEAVGFCDEYYFSKIFKKHMGVSPKNYLKLHQ